MDGQTSSRLSPPALSNQFKSSNSSFFFYIRVVSMETIHCTCMWATMEFWDVFIMIGSMYSQGTLPWQHILTIPLPVEYHPSHLPTEHIHPISTIYNSISSFVCVCARARARADCGGGDPYPTPKNGPIKKIKEIQIIRAMIFTNRKIVVSSINNIIRN